MRILKFIACLLILFTFFSCEEILYEDDISDSRVVILAPIDDAQFYSTSVTFSWEPVENATKYQIQIASPDFDNALQIVVDTETESTSITQQLNIGNYEWRVRAMNSAYETLYTTRKFTVVSNENFENNIVVLNNPADNLKTNVLSQNLSWQSIIGATGYQLQIYDNSNVLLVNQVLSNTNFNYTFSEGNYTWKVRATNGSVSTLYSSRSILVDTTSPNTPNLTSPSNFSSVSSSSISFDWNRTAISGSVEFDSIYIYSNVGLTDLVIKDRASRPHTESITNNGSYFWFVKSFDEAGNESAVSSTFTFIKN